MKIIGIILLVCLILFLLSIVVYFFNLDMKMSEKMIPIMMKHYDRAKVKRDKKQKSEN